MAPTAGDILFVDTNVLLIATDESRLQHRDAGRLLNESGRRGLHLAASGQILREYLVVATRPQETNGLGLQVRDATANVTEFLRCIHLYDETEEVARRLHQLSLTCGLARLRLRPTRHARRLFLAQAFRRRHTRRSLVPSRRKPFRKLGSPVKIDAAQGF